MVFRRWAISNGRVINNANLEVCLVSIMVRRSPRLILQETINPQRIDYRPERRRCRIVLFKLFARTELAEIVTNCCRGGQLFRHDICFEHHLDG